MVSRRLRMPQSRGQGRGAAYLNEITLWLVVGYWWLVIGGSLLVIGCWLWASARCSFVGFAAFGNFGVRA